MNTQNVKTATKESSERWGKDLTILMAEGEKGADYADYEVYEFSSLKELKDFRRTYPEKMKSAYSYIISAGTKPCGEHICLLWAAHCKQFIKQVEAAGFDF